MNCIKCQAEIPDGSLYCNHCGKKQTVQKRQRTKSRGNGTGTVYQLPNKTWCAEITVGWKLVDGKPRRVTRKKTGIKTKKEALAYLPTLSKKPKLIDTNITFKGLYELWFPTHKASKSTLGNYSAAFGWYEPIWYLKFEEIGIDDLQECIYECPRGIQTRKNMKTLGTLLYKYAIPRGYVPTGINYASFLKTGGGEAGIRNPFSAVELEIVRQSVGIVPYADYIYCMAYTGYRPFEFLSLTIEDYNQKEQCFRGGGKTEAGKNRLVTVSPKIQQIINRLINGKSTGPVFCAPDGSPLSLRVFREKCFYPAIEAMGIDNADHHLTPYSTRHTFATLIKNVASSEKDKLELMGHTSEEMLRHYQHVNYDDLRKITDAI